jgi:hypothetical protein
MGVAIQAQQILVHRLQLDEMFGGPQSANREPVPDYPRDQFQRLREYPERLERLRKSEHVPLFRLNVNDLQCVERVERLF